MSSSFGNNLIKKDAPPKGSKVTRPEDEERGDLIQFVWSSGRREKTRLDRQVKLYHKFFSCDEFHLETKPQGGAAQSSDF
jgi:hypothetical protein